MLGRGTPTKRVKRPKKAAKAPQTDFFTALCKSDLGVECVKEFRFCPERRWRFDYCIPAHKIALEVEGGVWTNGRHTRAQGFLGDVDKYNRGTLMGWRIFRTTPSALYSADTLNMLREAIYGPKSAQNEEKAPELRL